MARQGVSIENTDVGGIPAHGNQRSEWEAGHRFDFDSPDYR
jgi:hypothetical protein